MKNDILKEVLKEWYSEDKDWFLELSLCDFYVGIVADASFEVYEDGKHMGYYGAYLTKDQISTKEKLLATLKQFKSEFITGHYILAPRSMSAWIISDKITKEEFLRSMYAQKFVHGADFLREIYESDN